VREGGALSVRVQQRVADLITREMEMAVETVSAAETWERLESSAAYAACTGQQRVYVVAVLANGGDSISACRAAYATRDAHQAQVMAWEVAKKPNVVDAIALANGTASEEPTREQLIEECRRQLRRAKPGSVAASRLLFQLERLTMPDAKPAEQEQPEPAKTVPADAIQIWRDRKTGAAIGYRAANGEAIPL
jgi:hypothetical protein